MKPWNQGKIAMKSPKKNHEAIPPTIAARGNGSARPPAMALAPAVPPAPAPRSEWTPLRHGHPQRRSSGSRCGSWDPNGLAIHHRTITGLFFHGKKWKNPEKSTCVNGNSWENGKCCSWENGEKIDVVHGKMGKKSMLFMGKWGTVGRKTMGNGPVAHGQVTPCTINLPWPIRVGIYMLTEYIYILYIYVFIFKYPPLCSTRNLGPPFLYPGSPGGTHSIRSGDIRIDPSFKKKKHCINQG